MSDILCVTNRSLCKGDFLKRIDAIAKTRPAGILLREKDLSEKEYKALATEVLKICKKHRITCILHSFVNVASQLEHEAIHLPLPLLRTLPAEEKKKFSCIGVSCHSLAEAKEAEALGCSYLIAGHIFTTDCKKDVPPRGIEFLKEVCAQVEIPVFAIGGIRTEKLSLVKEAGAKGGCIMSGLMQCENPAEYLK